MRPLPRMRAGSKYGSPQTAISPGCALVLPSKRTIMSWLRTAVALIGFGFALVQYFNHLQQIPGARPAYLPTAPEFLGLALIACGVLALVVSIWQYRWTVRYLGRIVRADRRDNQGGDELAGSGDRHPPHRHRL